MKQRGFTLVEMSIVVVLISILLAGILSTRSLIGNAKAKDVVAIVDDIRTATVYFKKRYNYLPGDFPILAGDIVNVVPPGGDGNGSVGIVGDVNAQGQALAGSEVAQAPWQLFNAGFLGKINSTDPQRLIITSYGSVHIVSSNIANGLVPNFTAPNANSSARNAIVFFNLPCEIVADVDNKIDDGVTEFILGTNGRAFGTACVNGTVQWYAVTL